MARLDPKNGYATLINTFQVIPERTEALLTVLHEAWETMRLLPGFISANLHVNAEGTRVVNYVQWRSKLDFEAMLRDPQAQPHMRAAADLAISYEPIFYELRFSDEGPSARAEE